MKTDCLGLNKSVTIKLNKGLRKISNFHKQF